MWPFQVGVARKTSGRDTMPTEGKFKLHEALYMGRYNDPVFGVSSRSTIKTISHDPGHIRSIRTVRIFDFEKLR